MKMHNSSTRLSNKAIAVAAFAAVFALWSLPADAQLYIEPEQDVDCSVFIQKQGRGRAQQGMEFWDNWIFSLEDGGHVNVYDFRKADGVKIAGFELASSREDNHANNASFGTEIKKGASFPLLYITNGKVGSEIECTCFVESITRKGKKFHSELAQTLVLDIKGWEEAGYAAIFGAPSWMVDRERGFLWVFSSRQRTTPKVTKHNWENQYIATKFRVPTLSEGAVVHLGVDDILDQAVFPYETGFTQAGCVHDGKIYYCFGVGWQDPKRPSRVRIYDTDRRTLAARYELQDKIMFEPEDIVVRNGWMYVNTNTNSKKTSDPPCIFKLSLPKPKPAPKNPVEEILQDPEKAGGVYYVTDLSNPQTAAPQGYKPFYINGYFRHGARVIDDPVTIPAVYDCLMAADTSGNLTPYGKALYARLKPFRKNLEWREGDLTQIGYAQTRLIGQRMADNYPEVFRDEPYLRTRSTNVLRVAATMQSVNSGIQSRFPDLVWNVIDNSRSFLPELNPYGRVCPGIHPLDMKIYTENTAWFKKSSQWLDGKMDADKVLGRIFKDVTKLETPAGHRDLVRRLWLIACDMQCLDRQVPVWDMFTAEETLTMATAENFRYFCQKGPEPSSFGRSWQLGSRTLRYILEESRKDIALGRHGIDLNFGHDGNIMPMLVLLGTGTWAREASTPEDALLSWQCWNIPMGTNLQMVFYRNDEGRILVRLTLNEKDLSLPLEAVEGLYYDWKTFYDYYIEKCDAADKELERSAAYDISLF